MRDATRRVTVVPSASGSKVIVAVDSIAPKFRQVRRSPGTCSVTTITPRWGTPRAGKLHSYTVPSTPSGSYTGAIVMSGELTVVSRSTDTTSSGDASTCMVFVILIMVATPPVVRWRVHPRAPSHRRTEAKCSRSTRAPCTGPAGATW